MPAYNAQTHIAEAINSVIAQTLGTWELLVQDDDSGDRTAEIVKAFQKKDARIIYEKNARNVGVCSTRNRALERARGRYVAFLDADDVWTPEKLRIQVRFMDETDAEISYAAYYRIDGQGQVMGLVEVPEELGYKDMLRSNFIGNLTGIFRRASLSDARFEPVRHEDYLFWLRAIKRAGRARAASPCVPLAYYRVSTDSLSGNKIRSALWQWNIYRNVLHLSWPRSSFYFLSYAWIAICKRLSDKI